MSLILSPVMARGGRGGALGGMGARPKGGPQGRARWATQVSYRCRRQSEGLSPNKLRTVSTGSRAFAIGNGETRGGSIVPDGPSQAGRPCVFSRSGRPYGLKCEAFQTENALLSISAKCCMITKRPCRTPSPGRGPGRAVPQGCAYERNLWCPDLGSCEG